MNLMPFNMDYAVEIVGKTWGVRDLASAMVNDSRPGVIKAINRQFEKLKRRDPSVPAIAYMGLTYEEHEWIEDPTPLIERLREESFYDNADEEYTGDDTVENVPCVETVRVSI